MLCLKEGIIVGSVEIDQSGNTLGMTGADGTQLLPRDGMTGKYWTVEFQSRQHRKNVIAQSIRVIIFFSRRRLAGIAKSAPRDAVDVIIGNQLWGEFVKDMGVFPSPASRTNGLPVPPQSSTSKSTSFSTATNRTLCDEVSFHAVAGVAF